MDFISIWVIPPLVGAVIGYITNWLAIKMLFRPLREVRIWGIALPFTPGLLPRERNRISRSIGDIVATELLTADVVRRRIGEADVRESLAKGIDEKLEAVLASKAASVIPKEGASFGPIGSLVSGAWNGIVSSSAFREAVEQAVRRALVEAENYPLSRFIPPEKASELAALVLSPENVERLREHLGARVDAMFDESRVSAVDRDPAAGSLLPPDALEPIIKVLVEGIYVSALPALESFLGEPEMKASIGRYANTIVRDAVGRLNLFQRLIVGAAQYERSISEGMPKTVDDMVAAAMSLLRAPGMPERASAAAATAMRKAASGPLGESLRRIVSRQTAMSALDAAVDALARNGPQVAARAAALASSGSDASLASIVRSLGLPADEIASRTSIALSSVLSGSEGGADAARLLSASLAAFLTGLESGLGEASLGEALGTDGAARLELSSYLADRALELIGNEAGRIVEGLDVGRIVVERIDELDLIEVERMILGITNKELTWITVLGGVLGGIIGVFQSLFAYLSR
jgi:hypothetical protein